MKLTYKLSNKLSAKFVFIFSLIIFSMLFVLIFSINSVPLVSAADCWSYTTSAGCDDDSSCVWRNDSWGGWCEEYNCWSLWNQDDCQDTVISGKNCSWQGGGTSYSCEQVGCYSFDGTNEASCVSNSAGLTCEWSASCFGSGWSEGGTDCWSITTQSTCSNTTGCVWGMCNSKSCSSYSAQGTCNPAKDWRGNNCTWNSDGSYCEEAGCWNYATQSTCNAATDLDDKDDQDCVWKWDYCQEVGCWTWDQTNQSNCVNNTANISCEWSGSWCSEKGCWNYDQTTCEQTSKCTWASHTSGGWCKEVQCWSFDSWGGGSESHCANASTDYSLSCVWTNMSGSPGEGWCYQVAAGLNCTNRTTERECMDTFFCWWEYNDWNNPNLGGNCTEPDWGGIEETSIFNDWNPGCYVFDMNSTNCNNILGCEYSGGECVVTSGHSNENEINTNGINCTMVNDSSLCSDIPVLSSCCSWQGSNCTTSQLSTSCWDQLESTPEGASFCEDYKAYTDKALCEQIAGDPWYMPCKWDNSTERCGFKAGDVFGNESQSLVKIDNKKNCESAGGKWITENYCEQSGTSWISVPAGRCEYKFDEETNCDKACFACELRDSSGNTINSTNAESACKGSALGYCTFTTDTNAPNAIGYCKAKKQFKEGVATDCDTDCGACTYMGDSLSNDTSKKPSYFCSQSKANSDGGRCKWVTDNSTNQGGYCIKKGEKTCEDACDRCYTQSNCANLGRTSISNSSGSCKWQGTSSDGSCVSNTGESVEICWDGIDNNNNSLIDCADSNCYSDSYCGYVSGDCFGWTDNTSCYDGDCEWVSDNWGSWCDFKGSSCWKYDTNEINCSSQSNCQWSNGTGYDWCETDWSIEETCMSLNRTNCWNIENCVWTNDTWCDGTGSGSSWCNSSGGWCDHSDFQPKNCWLYQSSSSECNNETGCNWHTDQYTQSHCEVNYSANCWNMSSSECSASPFCYERTDTWGSWCTNIMDKCWSSSTQSTCASQVDDNSNKLCYWDTWGNYCQPLCFNSTNSANQNNCNSASGCYWRQESGWCEESHTNACSESNVSSNEADCDSTPGCRWKSSGWCDPEGGGFSGGAIVGGGGTGGSMGAECYKYDGNQSSCTNKTIINISCGWYSEPSPRCDVNWTGDCWQYLNSSDCDAGSCWWYNDTEYGGTGSNAHCVNLMDQCSMNETLNNATGAGIAGFCNNNTYCNATIWGNCEPTCFSATNSSSCGTGCRWITGWCNPAGMNEMFTGMEAGAPVPLGADTCDGSETTQSSADICGFGMKDMSDSYGFGVSVYDFSNASICNKETISGFVMGMMGGGYATSGESFAFGTERVGSGNETVKFFVYLDSDGSTNGGCSLTHDSTTSGYEFKFRYVSEWDSSKSKAVETFNAYKCENSDWKSTDIKLSTWKKKMCSEIGGGMIAVEKSDLERYPTLYDSTKDLRVFVATADNTHNASSPSDLAGPGWTSPGAIDFDINDAFSYGADVAKFEDVLRKGFINYEDCFNDIDDDGDGGVDCGDYDCQFAKVCENYDYSNDTSAPRVTSVKLEEYTDAALIMYDTNKPSNGTLKFYYNDSNCLKLNTTIYDVGILKNNTVREHKLWHQAYIYNDGSAGENISLNSKLDYNTTYYYKLEVCDSAGRCGVSKCSSFTTSFETRCSFCNFVTRIKVPSGWTVNYDTDQDGIYGHVQGAVCGANAGMKTNYTIGRQVNIKINKTDGTTAMEFFNVTLTKTGLNSKTREISSSNAIISNNTATDSSGDSIGYTGMISETRDKIINNLHPEICRMTIPRGDTACTALWHCDDNGNNCVDRTTESSLVSSTTTTCTWQLPFCEFSVWASGQPGTPPATTTAAAASGGGGGGGGGAAGKTYAVTDEQFEKGYSKELEVNDQIKMNISAEWHYAKLAELKETTATVNVSSEVQQASLLVGQSKNFDVTDDGVYDLNLKLNSITYNATTKLVNVSVIKYTGQVEEIPEAEEAAEEVEEAIPAEEITPSRTWLIIAIVIIVIIIIAIVLIVRAKKR